MYLILEWESIWKFPVSQDQAKKCEANVDSRNRRSWKTRHGLVVTTVLADGKEGAVTLPKGIGALWICFSLKSDFFLHKQKNLQNTQMRISGVGDFSDVGICFQ